MRQLTQQDLSNARRALDWHLGDRNNARKQAQVKAWLAWWGPYAAG